jgi:DinB superfamily
MPVERCGECGFDGDDWTDASALDAIGELPERFRTATAGIGQHDAVRRPLPATWSIVEYVDHVREVLVGMRFVLGSALAQPGVDLGEAPEPRFDPEPRAIDLDAALDGLEREAVALGSRLREVPEHARYHKVTVGEDELDARWTCRHAVHDATHHLMDVERLRAALLGHR